MSPSERRKMVRKNNTVLSLTRQCKLLKISRSLIDYTPVGFDQATIDLMHEIDLIFTKHPFFGSRQIAAYLPQSGLPAGRHRRTPLDVYHGLTSHLQRSQHQQEASSAPNLSVSAQKTGNHAAQSGLVQRYHLHPCETGLPVSGSNNGLGNTQGAFMAALKYAGRQLLR